MERWGRIQVLIQILISSNFTQKFKLRFWLSSKLFFNRQILFGGSAPLAFVGLVLGVAVLVASMSVMRGFEFSLKKAMIDVTGDIQIVKRGRLVDDWADFSAKIKKIDSRILKMARFAQTEAVIASRGKVSGVLVQGVDFSQTEGILNLQSRVILGDLKFAPGTVAIGSGLAKRFSLKIDDEIYLAVSQATPFEDQSFKRQSQNFKISAVIDFGKNEWNERLVVSGLHDFQQLTSIGDRYTGALVKISNSDQAQELSRKIEDSLGVKFSVLNWFEVNKNLFKAVQYEGVIIFFVVFLIVIVAAFNISSTLYVLIRQRFKDIAILKALGSQKSNVQWIFVGFGVWVAVLGSFLGFLFGFALSEGFMWLQTKAPVISGAVYRIDRIDIQISFFDFFIIFCATLIACLCATYPPALRGSRLHVVDGLRED